MKVQNSKQLREVKSTLNNIPSLETSKVQKWLQDELSTLNKKIIVLDDDPTGVQTVNNISVYTDWSVESIKKGFLEENSMFFILTNSRAFSASKTEEEHQKIAEHIAAVAQELNKEFIIISRGDSTLRGHYPLETEILKETVENKTNLKFDGEVIFPFFKEGGRYTIDNIHYVQDGETLVPAGETEFAKDRTFGYKSSHLGEWIEEKTEGRFTAENATYLTLEHIRALDIDYLTEQLLEVKDFNKVIVNAVDYVDVMVVTIALIKAMKNGKNYMFRTAAAITKIIGGVVDRGLLTTSELVESSEHGGLILIGSHVQKTTQQLEQLKQCEFIDFIQFDTHLVLNPEEFEKERDHVLHQCEQLIADGKTVAVYTRRERLDLGQNKKEEELELSVKISEAVTSIVKFLKVKPRFIIAKGGITSSDIGVNGLSVQRATVAGQIKPGIPVWLTGEESKFPHMAYIIFPGNVGEVSTLREVVEMLS
ncbi:four-carbon acid sugar kinase family protein [Priestia endophytica]|uniref:four-carbon acid sugar kinase family protein n=1 Tax=Priestia endophytica TaxID=135735 RepID=UPI000F549596|nr:four-carbon acid sugar kinase family protein [Priestia endophytica]RPK05922.1 hypothetical protein FH5_01851 [Priestia endophytica]